MGTLLRYAFPASPSPYLSSFLKGPTVISFQRTPLAPFRFFASGDDGKHGSAEVDDVASGFAILLVIWMLCLFVWSIIWAYNDAESRANRAVSLRSWSFYCPGQSASLLGWFSARKTRLVKESSTRPPSGPPCQGAESQMTAEAISGRVGAGPRHLTAP